MSTSQQNRESPITIPTSELTTAGEHLTVGEHFTPVESLLTNNDGDIAYTNTPDDVRLATEYYERIGRREKLHEWAVERHLKERTQASLGRVITTFDKLHRVNTQTPPPDIGRIDVKAAMARGRAAAFGEDTAEAEREWAYNHPHEAFTAPRHGGTSYQLIRSHTDGEDTHAVWNADDAKAALDRIQSLVKCLLPEDALD
ncbi:hypothetical protein C8F04DRAFT_1264978 [Mycena alexandri]|uniref:Uncharacterized protein n=1 Tax=Mycena alexandri TaxID=1745969 RepID=A0AAD6WXW2_9AGAR|nr:hypothetical protein C8F04DRAFT_1264978 [Mycena alexandri]